MFSLRFHLPGHLDKSHWGPPAVGLASFLAALLAQPVKLSQLYAHPIWLPAGVALAGMLVFRARCIPWILISALFSNLIHLSGQPLGLAYVAALGIALGATLQAVVAGWMVSRLCRNHYGLDRLRDISAFVICGGPVACLISATVGVTNLSAFGILSETDRLGCWLSWWWGDSLGVLLAAPIGMTLLAQPRELWRRRRKTVALPLAAGLVAIMILFTVAYRIDLARDSAEFQRRAAAFSGSLRTALEESRDTVIVAANLFGVFPNIDSSQFREALQETVSGHPWITAVLWAPRVEAKDLAVFEKKSSRIVSGGFKVFRFDQNASRTAPTGASELFPVTYVEPQAENRVALGFELTSEPARAEAMAWAREHGKERATRPLKTIDRSAGFASVLFKPVFHDTSRAADKLLGFAAIVIRFERLLSVIGSGLPDYRFAYRLEDISVPEKDRVLVAKGIAMASPPYALESLLSFGNRSWQLRIWPTAEYLQANQTWYIPVIHAGAVVLTGLVLAILLQFSGRGFQIESLVAERTRKYLEASEAANHANRLLMEAINAMPHGFSLFDPLDRLVICNDAFKQIYAPIRSSLIRGVKFETLIRIAAANGLVEGVGEQDQPWVHDQLEHHARANGQPVERRMSDGRWLMIVDSRTPNGYVAGNRIDITPLRIATSMLEDRNAQLDALFTMIPDGLLAMDHDEYVRLVNPSFLEILGLQKDEILDKPFHEIETLLAQRLERPGLVQCMLCDGRQSSRPCEQQILKIKSPTEKVVQVQAIQADSQSLPYLVYLRDITREAEVDRMKSEFLAHAAHELRTPMASVLGYSELLLKMEFEEPVRTDMLQTIHNQALWLTQILNELLDLARIEARREQDLVPEVLDLVELAGEVVTSVNGGARQVRVMLDEPLTGMVVFADRAKSRQVMLNVVSNAVKFSPEGGTVHITGLADQRNVGIAVTDFGIGMSEEELAQAGQRFWRAEKSGSIPGTGLGLAIAMEILRLHGGRLELMSSRGQGTTARLWWPRMEPAIETEPRVCPGTEGNSVGGGR